MFTQQTLDPALTPERQQTVTGFYAWLRRHGDYGDLAPAVKDAYPLLGDDGMRKLSQAIEAYCVATLGPICPACKGKGIPTGLTIWDAYPCPDCNGAGRIKAAEKPPADND